MSQCVPQGPEHLDEMPESEPLQDNQLSDSTQSLPHLEHLPIGVRGFGSIAALTVAQPITSQSAQSAREVPEVVEARRVESFAKRFLFHPDVAKKLRAYVLFTNDDQLVDRFRPRGPTPTAESELF